MKKPEFIYPGFTVDFLFESLAGSAGQINLKPKCQP